ncbi:cyclic pyranopterin monophosphate synthase MoaC [Magnetofaba australis]|nr:cyclic pyranopterin monophosphate synthase MoaC [Magnetofaba australis]
MSDPLSHFDETGAATMVDVGAKAVTERIAIAGASVCMQPQTLQRILAHGVAKGDVMEVARIAGIMAAKKVDQLIPLCHQLNLTSVKIHFEPVVEASRLEITARVKTSGQTGVEMEALTAASVTALTVYDMVKAMDRAVRIEGIRLLEKCGGKSGHFVRSAQDEP